MLPRWWSGWRLQTCYLVSSECTLFNLITDCLQISYLTFLIIINIWWFSIIGLPLLNFDLLKIIDLSLIILHLREGLVAAYLVQTNPRWTNSPLLTFFDRILVISSIHTQISSRHRLILIVCQGFPIRVIFRGHQHKCPRLALPALKNLFGWILSAVT